MALAVALLLVIASIGGIYYSRYRQKKKSSERLQMMNEEKEVLLHEIHHRVKNNLQIISSLINLKSRQASTETNDRQLNGRIFFDGTDP
ncbi:MAG: histidine kinase dimerization/phosphoacceptor domain -containing protein [Bacteroidota bacterium]